MISLSSLTSLNIIRKKHRKKFSVNAILLMLLQHFHSTTNSAPKYEILDTDSTNAFTLLNFKSTWTLYEISVVEKRHFF